MSAVDALIAEAKQARPPRFSEAVIADLRRLMEANDSGVGRRITAEMARAAIKKDHGVSMGLTQFLNGVREVFGRTWGGSV